VHEASRAGAVRELSRKHRGELFAAVAGEGELGRLVVELRRVLDGDGVTELKQPVTRRVATDAADAAADAADAADRLKILQKCADIVRKYHPKIKI
jgi:hypothetical protein